ncbi:hypothetical protein EHQ68_15495 [Leptospira congkakensis]|uniref:Uncharacterized protein n=1 Tax=Leptospira congkakensis TaxID=2484932 RepID=A0A4Z1A6U6_9LEPT|nr:hypothetical protein [Leptospira congkakensis]TGL86701.1 hypothetical protein EHQ68_15495 [Leptospira congkakensis]TGL93754.1 hypothetical protein EHQ69_04535 [Leptospira congkakensis]TGL94840.1 hypothetical protein EHQ70_16260 [Leptospira congkakensis]
MILEKQERNNWERKVRFCLVNAVQEKSKEGTNHLEHSFWICKWLYNKPRFCEKDFVAKIYNQRR